MLYREFPFLRIGIPLCLGIISGLFLKPERIFVIPLLVLSVTGFISGLRFNKHSAGIIYGVSLNIILWLAGLLLYSNEKSTLSILDPAPARYLCTVTEYPEEKPGTFQIILKIEGKVITSHTLEPVRGSLLMYLRKKDAVCNFIPGDIIIIGFKPVPIENRGNPDEFDYSFYMENRGIKFYAIASESDIVSRIRPRHIKPKYKALIIREKIIDMYRTRGITGERLALVAAITLGQKNMLDTEQKQMFMKAGIMHIMAVSGLHAVILSLFIFKLLFFLKGRFNFLRVIITVLLLWMFAFVTGLTPSVLRATLMFSFIQAGNLMKRNPNSINSVLASAFFLMLNRPSVIFDAGFLLSYSAVIFIILFYQELYMKLNFKSWLPDKIWQSAAVTLTAQAGTLPLTVSLFNRFPTWFLLTNIVIVPLSSLLIIVGCIIPLTYPLKFISGPLASLLGILTAATQFLTDYASRIPFASIENLGMKPLQTFILFIAVLAAMRFMLNRKSLSALFPVGALLMFEIAGCITDFSGKAKNELIVYNSTRQFSFAVRSGRTLNLFTDSAYIVPEAARQAASGRLKVRLNLLEKEQICIDAAKKRVLISNALNNWLLTEYKPDFIILRGKYPRIEYPLDYSKPAGILIVTSEVKSTLRAPDASTGMRIHNIRKSGAFITHL